jgi:hypothetical protein
MPGPYYCEGPLAGGGCRLGARGGRASIKGKCKHDARCAEKRCASHCKCARMGWRKGACSGRPRGAALLAAANALPKAKAKAKAQAKASAALPLAVPPRPPIERTLKTDVKKLLIVEWYRQMLADSRKASEVLVSSYMYDHPDLQQLLLRRLQGKAQKPFELTVLLDMASYNGQLPARQKARITALRGNGAKVVLCTGARRGCTFHKKAVIVDRRFLYTGGANITYASEHGNGELVYRMVGQPALDTYDDLAADEARGRVLE